MPTLGSLRSQPSGCGVRRGRLRRGRQCPSGSWRLVVLAVDVGPTLTWWSDAGQGGDDDQRVTAPVVGGELLGCVQGIQGIDPQDQGLGCWLAVEDAALAFLQSAVAVL